VSVGIENPVHLLFIAVVVLLVLGPKRLPGLARALGQGIREFRAALEEGAEGDGEIEPPPRAGGQELAPRPAGEEAARPPGPPQEPA
jgi:sec-independent protein translocase protein TatA